MSRYEFIYDRNKEEIHKTISNGHTRIVYRRGTGTSELQSYVVIYVRNLWSTNDTVGIFQMSRFFLYRSLQVGLNDFKNLHSKTGY